MRNEQGRTNLWAYFLTLIRPCTYGRKRGERGRKPGHKERIFKEPEKAPGNNSETRSYIKPLFAPM